MNTLYNDDIVNLKENSLLNLINKYISLSVPNASRVLDYQSSDDEDPFISILKLLDITEVKKVEGYTKNPRMFKKDMKLYDTTYWYIVEINNHKHFIDLNFYVHKDYTIDYGFCVLPQVFIYTHFFLNTKDLLLESQGNMISLDVFESLTLFLLISSRMDFTY